MGLQPNEYWEMSFDEINSFLEVMQEKHKETQKHEFELEFMNAYWQRKEKLSSEDLKEIFRGIDKPKKMTDTEMFNKIKALTIAFGGEIKETRI